MQAGDNVRRPVCGSASACRWCGRRRPAGGSSRSCACPVSGLRENTIGSVMKRPPSCGQQCRIGKSVEREIVAPDHLLARARRNRFRKDRRQVGQLRQHLELAEQAFGLAHLDQFRDASGDLIRRGLKRDLHAPHAGEGVDQHRNVRTLGLFKQQRGAAVFTLRSANSVISRCGSTSKGMRFSSPRFSSARTKSRRSS